MSSFLQLDEDELSDIGFKFSSVRTIKNELNKHKEARKLQTQMDQMKENTFNLIKTLQPKGLLDECIEPEFSRVILDEISLESLAKAFSSNDLTTELKPYLFDCLKRNSNLKDFKEEIFNSLGKLNLTNKVINSIELMTERNLITGLIESVSQANKPRLGYLISKNNYPMPLAYDYFCPGTNQTQTKIDFGIFTDAFCATDKCVALVSGSRNACKKGKSSLIPILFSGLNGSVEMVYNTDNQVDIISNSDSTSEWIVADFHGATNTFESLNLIRSIRAYSTIHFLNTTLEDFNQLTQKPSQEIVNMLREYQDSEFNPKLVLLVRDVNEADDTIKTSLDNIRKQLNMFYNKKHVLVEGIPNLVGLKSRKTWSCQSESFARLNNYIESTKRKEFGSIEDIKRVYGKLIKNECPSIETRSKSSFGNIRYFYDKLISSAGCRSKSPFETAFNKAFNSTSIKKHRHSIYSVSKLNKMIYQMDKRLKALANSSENSRELIKSLSRDLKKLHAERSQLEPFNQQIRFFIQLILDLDENSYSNLFVFEKCLNALTKDNLTGLNESRVVQDSKSNVLRGQLKNIEKNQDLVANDDKLNELRVQLKKSDEMVELLDNQIDDLDLKLDKFWDELFLIFDWLDEYQKSDESTEQMRRQVILKYTKLLGQGFNIHLLRGNPLKLESKFIEQVLEVLTGNTNIYIISIIGEQSSAKSSLLNSLFGFDFKTSVGRCTNGIYMNFIRVEERTIVILDTEGLMSVESGNQVLDNQMTTMAVLSSHLILVNHKGEISSNLERVLGITFYAKLRISKSGFKPSILFVLRDQMDRDKDVIAFQARKLKEKLMQQTQFIDESLDSILDIDTQNVILLPNAFSEEQLNGRTHKWRNSLFPNEILKARRFIVNHLFALDTSQHTFGSLKELYSRMSFDWRTLEDIGEGIMSCRDLEELRVRNEISKKTNTLIELYMHKLTNECNDLISGSLIKLSAQYSTSLSEDVFEQLEALHQTNKAELLTEYKKQTNVSFYPEILKHEYLSQIENSLNYIISLNLKKMKTHDLFLKQNNLLQQEHEKMIEEISDIIKVNSDSNEIENIVDAKIDEFYLRHSRIMSDAYPDNNCFIREIQKNFNLIVQRKRHICNGVFEMISTIQNLDDMIGHKESTGEYHLQIKHWLKQNHKKVHMNARFVLVLEEVENNLAPKVTSRMSSYFLEESNLTEAFLLIENYFNKQQVAAIFHENILNSRKLLIEDCIHVVLYCIYKKLIELRELSKQEEDYKYEEKVDELRQTIRNHLDSANDSKATGLYVAEKISNNIYKFLLEKEKVISSNEIQFRIDQILKSPQNLVQMAFNKSFEESNYENVLKYVKDI